MQMQPLHEIFIRHADGHMNLPEDCLHHHYRLREHPTGKHKASENPQETTEETWRKSEEQGKTL